MSANDTLTHKRLPWFIIMFIVIFLLGHSVQAWTQIKLTDFNDAEYYTVEDGLPSSYITNVAEDKYGFLWVATGNGVARFDGSQFTNYTRFVSDSVKVKFGFVESIIFDPTGTTIWIGCDEGILFSSVDSINFRKPDMAFPPNGSLYGKKAELLYTADNKLWATNSKEGLFELDLNQKKYHNYIFSREAQKDTFLLSNLTCFTVDPSSDSIFWLGTIGGLIKFNQYSGRYTIFTYGNDPEMAQNQIRKIEASETEVFLGTWSKGLVIFNKKTKHFRYLLPYQNETRHYLIHELYKENDSSLWITTNEGLAHYDLVSDKLISIIGHKEEEGIFKGVSMVDSRGIIWYCSGKGLFKYDPLRSQNVYIELEKRSSIQPPLGLREILYSEGFYYALGVSGSGLYKINPGDNSFEIIENPFLQSKNSRNTTLRDMVKMDNGDFLIVSEEITRFTPKTKKIVPSPLQIEHPFPSIQAVVKDKNRNYWIGTRTAGLYRINFDNNTLKNYREEFDLSHTGNYTWINRLFIDSKNILWIGKGSTTLMNLNDTTIHCLDTDDKTTITTYQDVLGFYEDKSGRVWMAGGPDGLGYTNYETFSKGVSHVIDGYFSGVYKCNDSLLWTTGKNLGILNLNTLKYSEADLRYHNKKLTISGPILPAGEDKFLIGCDNGILVYSPSKQLMNSEIPSPYIREIVSDGKTKYKGNRLDNGDFTFPSGTKHIVFNISSLGFHFPDDIKLRYRFEDGWHDIGRNNEIHLTNLSYGDYTLEIKACNNLGNCSQLPVTYTISIHTPWWVSWWAIAIYLGLAVLLADRFYRFQLSKRLAIAESRRLKDVNRLKSDLYTNITHEFRTPLTVILGMADSIKSAIRGKQIVEADHALEMINRNGNNMLRLVNELLDLSKLESGKMELQLVQADVIPFLKYVCEGFQSMANEKHIHFTLYSENDELVMDFDANKLSAIISNVISNAVKFTVPGGTIIIHIKRVLYQKNEYLYVKVKDDGPGIPQEKIRLIFDRFYQADNSLNRQGGGTGIGLALTKELIELMKGTIEVKSHLGEGSEFIIHIPISHLASSVDDIKVDAGTNLPNVSAEEKVVTLEPHEASELPQVLIIEDNADVTHYLNSCLRGKYKTIHAFNGEEGIRMAFEKVPDIIICDVMMPVKDGFKVCSEIKNDERTDHIPVILLTARVTTLDRITGLSSGADAYLTKPFVKAELLTRLEQLLLLRKKMMQKIENNPFSHFLQTKAENPETRFLQKIISIIHEEISNHSFGSSAHLSRKLQLSESQIYRKLKAITGKSTAVFIRSVRLQKAKELIQSTDKSISEIAYEVGFNDPSWFGRAFKEEFGYSPGAISKNLTE
jgi:signal transduction histidine kinase/DNA-binding response OmpR family regulator/ligand-binding sensor domain-containing protein